MQTIYKYSKQFVKMVLVISKVSWCNIGHLTDFGY